MRSPLFLPAALLASTILIALSVALVGAVVRAVRPWPRPEAWEPVKGQIPTEAVRQIEAAQRRSGEYHRIS